jgi:hypothetical protein
VSDEGTLTSFDLKLKATALIVGGIRGSDGRLYSVDPPKLYTVSTEIDGIDPNHPDIGGTFGMHLGGRAVGHSFLGHQYYEDKIAEGLIKTVRSLVTFNVSEIAGYYKQAEKNWQTPGNCVTVTPTASSTMLAPGQQEPVTVTITGPPKKGTAPGRFTASTSAGTVSPASGTYTPGQPLALTFTAPQSGTAAVSVDTTSRQGKGHGSLSFTVQPKHYEVRLISDMPLTWSPTPQPPPVTEPHGTGSADYAVDGAAELTGDPTAAAGASGTGTLTWTHFAYDDENVQNLCQDGKYMNTTYTGTTSAPGTLKVTSLVIASLAGGGADPGVTLHFAVSQEPSETIHIVYSKGTTACADFSIDNTYHDWAELYLPEGTYGASETTGFAVDPTAGPHAYTVTGWTRASGPAGQNGTLVATKDLTYPISDGKGGNGTPGGTGSGHLTFQIVAIP